MPILKASNHAEDEPGRRRPRRRRLRSIAMLPSMATLGNLICGFAAIFFAAMYYGGREPDLASGAMMSKYLPSYLAIAGYLIFLALFWDALDGQLARLTRSSSEFGAQLDSLADVVSFGAAPAFLVIFLLEHTLQGESVTPVSTGLFGRLAWVMAAVYFACTALRLARFNVETVDHESAHNSFRGLPSPAAGATVATLVVLHEDVLRVLGEDEFRSELYWASNALVKALPFVLVVLGLLMVSRIRYTHMANAYLRGRRPFTHLVGAVFLFAVFLFRPQLTLAALATLYTLSGPFFYVIRRLRGAPAHPHTEPAHLTDSGDSDDRAAQRRA